MTRPFALVLAVSLFACNTAQISTPPSVDSGAGTCPSLDSVPLCDAGGATVGCEGDPDSGYAAINGLPSGQVIPIACKVQRSAVNQTTGECDIISECQCVERDGGADGGAAGWSCLTSH